MSADLLALLSRESAFDPTPLPTDLAALHVPFDTLTSGHETEGALRAAAHSSGRVALVGPMGSGKSSVLAHVFQPDEGFAPIQVSVAPEHEETVTEPGAFAQHVVRVVSTWAADVEMLSEKEREQLLRAVSDRRVLPSRSAGTRGGIAVQLPWLAKAELARELRSELQTSEGIARSAAEQRYLTLDEYREGTVGILNTRIDVPRLSSRDQLARILNHRVALHAADGSGHDVFEAPALQLLWDFYAADADFSLRKTLQIAHTALSDASRAGHELIGPELVDGALAAWPPPRR